MKFISITKRLIMTRTSLSHNLFTLLDYHDNFSIVNTFRIKILFE